MSAARSSLAKAETDAGRRYFTATGRIGPCDQAVAARSGERHKDDTALLFRVLIHGGAMGDSMEKVELSGRIRAMGPFDSCATNVDWSPNESESESV